jgi:metal-responsive CopG/Arc/MetJ family transcriptional regulator
MKTAISIPDPLFLAAEDFAREHGLSRSELYTRAIQRYLESVRYLGVTESLNQLYATETSDVDPGFARVQHSVLEDELW